MKTYENETYINGKDIWITYKARLIHDSFTNLLTPANRKDFTRNEARSQPGIEIYTDNPQPQDREVQITFLLECTDRKELLQKYKALTRDIERGLVELKAMPTETIYKMVVISYVSLEVYGNDNKAILGVRLLEPNPKDVKSTLITAYTLSAGGRLLTTHTKILTTNIE